MNIDWHKLFFPKQAQLIESLNVSYELLRDQYNLLKSQKETAEQMIIKLEEANQLCKEKLAKEIKTEELEDYWNNRIKPTTLTYGARYWGTKRIPADPRIYFNPTDSLLPIISGKSNDEIAIRCHNWVIYNIIYKAEDKETWQFPFETLHRRAGDCEDGAIVMANMMLKAGIPYWRIRLNAGSVQGGGHAYVTYLAEDGIWYVLDWCYWPKESQNLKKKWKDAEKYNEEDKNFGIWFSWNTKYIFRKDDLDK